MVGRAAGWFHQVGVNGGNVAGVWWQGRWQKMATAAGANPQEPTLNPYAVLGNAVVRGARAAQTFVNEQWQAQPVAAASCRESARNRRRK